jgi:hypothetical protein
MVTSTAPARIVHLPSRRQLVVPRLSLTWFSCPGPLPSNLEGLPPSSADRISEISFWAPSTQPARSNRSRSQSRFLSHSASAFGRSSSLSHKATPEHERTLQKCILRKQRRGHGYNARQPGTIRPVATWTGSTTASLRCTLARRSLQPPDPTGVKPKSSGSICLSGVYPK